MNSIITVLLFEIVILFCAAVFYAVSGEMKNQALDFVNSPLQRRSYLNTAIVFRVFMWLTVIAFIGYNLFLIF